MRLIIKCKQISLEKVNSNLRSFTISREQTLKAYSQWPGPWAHRDWKLKWLSKTHPLLGDRVGLATASLEGRWPFGVSRKYSPCLGLYLFQTSCFFTVSFIVFVFLVGELRNTVTFPLMPYEFLDHHWQMHGAGTVCCWEELVVMSWESPCALQASTKQLVSRNDTFSEFSFFCCTEALWM